MGFRIVSFDKGAGTTPQAAPVEAQATAQPVPAPVAAKKRFRVVSASQEPQKAPVQTPQQQAEAQAAQQLGQPSQGEQVSTISSKGDSGVNGTKGGAQPWNNEVLHDMDKSFSEGMFQGVVGLAGIPRAASDLAQTGVEYGAQKLGFSPETAKSAGGVVAAISPGSYLPSAQQMSDAVHGHDGTKEYQPKSTAGDYSKAVGEMVPSALAGPGGAIRKTAMTVIPAVAGQAVGDATGNEYAKAAAQILTGGVTAGFKRGAGNKVIADLTKENTAKALKSAVSDAYTAAENTVGKSQMHPQDFAKIVRGLNTEAIKKGVGGALSETTDKLYSTSKSIVSDMSKIMQDVARGNRPPPTFNEIEKFRQTLNDVVQGSKDVAGKMSPDGYLANQFIQHLDDVIAKTPFKEARLAYRTLRKTERIQKAIDDAGTRSSSADLAFKNEFKKIERENLKNNLFSPAEMESIKQVAGHGRISNLLEGLGRAGFSSKSVTAGSVSSGLVGSMAGYAGVNPLLAAGTSAAITTGAKVLGTRMTKAAAERARGLVSVGGDTAEIDSKLFTAQRAIDQRRLIGATARSQEIQKQRNDKLQKAKNVNPSALLKPKS